MFSFKNKIDDNLQYYLSLNSYKSYRILIKYKNFEPSIKKKIISFKGTVYYTLDSINIISADLNPRGINRILEYPEVEKIYLDEYLFLCGMSVYSANKVFFPSEFSLSGNGVGIGIVDSGIFPHHDLTSYGNSIKLFVDLINNLQYPYDDNGHGTCIGGILCANSYSQNNLYKGICSKSKLFCYKAFNKLGRGFASDVLFSIQSLTDISKENNIRILCLPFELLNHNSFIMNLFKEIFDYCISNNVIPILPSGSNINTKQSITGISTLENCITVSGVDTTTKTAKPYTYSSIGPYRKTSKPDLCAACVNIVSLNSNTNYISEKNGVKLYPPKLDAPYKTFSGTSLAAAYVCGICSLIIEKQPDISFKDITSLLKIYCKPLDDIPAYIQGHGIIDVKNI